ncbi:hypothetical protein J7T55_001379 [Diaporthe amygdali]|uniref:uncharacterized protein n=1 Tax=Phomopsis amygdali TaxID=1214568 RepID=UPI0022FEF951|nr:uncharacterized protein J7T55_001379 [Diaporthe amygdali]KAJ0100712.1 hypothetical protein J7T55_001379 [Diaporthe amygdali]
MTSNSKTSTVNVVLGSEPPQWLTKTLERINCSKHPRDSALQHQRCLTETLANTNAIWSLTSLMLAKAPATKLVKDSNPLIEAFLNDRLIHVEAHIINVDIELSNTVAFKLTSDSIESLVEYHKNVHCANTHAETPEWPDKDRQCKELHQDFVKAINSFVYCTHASVLEGLEQDGAGELLNGRSEEVKAHLMGLMKSLTPPQSDPLTPAR